MRNRVSPVRQRMADRVKAAGGIMSAGLARICGPRTEAALGILMFHRIAEPVPGLPPPGLNVTPERFRQQITGLLGLGYRFIGLPEAIACLSAGERLDDRTAALTFDDGFAGVYQHAWPILADLGVPAAVFPVTRYVGSRIPMPFDMWGTRYSREAPSDSWRSVSWEELREIAHSPGMEVGCHTHTHRAFRDDAQAFRIDCDVASYEISRHVGQAPSLFAFPFGDPDLGYTHPRLMEEVRCMGLQCALTTRTGRVAPGESPFGWPRLEVGQSDSAATLHAKLQGWYDWMNTARRVVHRAAPW